MMFMGRWYVRAEEKLDEAMKRVTQQNEEMLRTKSEAFEAYEQANSGDRTVPPGTETEQGKAQEAKDKELEEQKEIDRRSVFVKNLDPSVEAEELQEIFSSCGTIQRVTIPTDKFKNPKG